MTALAGLPSPGITKPRSDTKAKAYAAVAAWAEGLTGNERRWMSRWLNFGKAEEQVFAAAEKALDGHMRWLVIDGLEELRNAWRKEVNGK